MKSSRIVLAAVALLCAVAGTFAIVAPSSAAPGRTATAKPKVGQCRDLTAAQGDPMANNSPTVPCSSPHTTYTFAVPNLARGVDAKHLSAAKFLTAGVDACTPRWHKFLGRSWGIEDQTMFSYMFFAPTKAQRAHGARWVRCDLILQSGGDINVLPAAHRPLLQGPLSNSVRRCRNQGGVYVTCDQTHVTRTAAFFNVMSKKRPTPTQFIRLGEKNCPVGDRAFFGWPNKYNWALGDRAEVCYRHTTS
ncbi:MAG TPA: septum formation family protein [Marmoricola sp.]|jgi:hypothetical protein|nr:septum formation family protein [Marmoricola sp.]